MQKPKRSKYNARKTVVDGIRFDSKAEAKRYQELKMLERAGEVKELQLQYIYPLMVPGVGNGGAYERVCVGKYIADFRYRKGPRGLLMVEDVKGVKTAIYRLKKKMVEAQYNITITEVAR